MSMKLKSILFGGVCGLAAAESFAGKPTFLRFDMSPYGEKDWRNVYNKGKPIGKQIMPVPLWAYEKDGKTHFAEFRIVKKWEGNGEDCYRMYVYCDPKVMEERGTVGFRMQKTDDGILHIEGMFFKSYGSDKREVLSREEGERLLRQKMAAHGADNAMFKELLGAVSLNGILMVQSDGRTLSDLAKKKLIDLYSCFEREGRYFFKEKKEEGNGAFSCRRPSFFAAMGAFSDPSSSFCPSFLPSAGHLADTSPLKWKRLNALREFKAHHRGAFGDCEEALDIGSLLEGFSCFFTAYSEAAKKKVRFEVIFFSYDDDFRFCSLKEAGLCSFCREFREVLGYWYDPSCFEKKPSCSLFETNKILQNQLSDGNKIETEPDPFKEDGGHPVFLRDCDLSVLPPDDVRRKHNIQPFQTLGYVSWDDDTRECYVLYLLKKNVSSEADRRLKKKFETVLLFLLRFPTK